MKVPDGYKRCKCRDEEGRELGPQCPKLKRKDGSWSPSHGTYYGKTIVPVPDGEPRADLRAGGFASREEMTDWFSDAIALLSIPAKGPDGYRARMQILALIRQARRVGESLPSFDDIRRRHATGAALELGTSGEYLLSWVARHERERDLKPSTLRGYRAHVEDRLIPHLGEVPLQKLNADHIWRVFEAVDRENAKIIAARASDDPGVRKSVAGRTPTGIATKRRSWRRSAPRSPRPPVSAGQEAARRGQRCPGGQARPAGRQAEDRPLEGAAVDGRAGDGVARAARRAQRRAGQAAPLPGAWKNAEMRPSNVMIWKPDHLGQFLDSAAEDRLYPMLSLIAYCGLRRGEATGLRWEDVDFEAGAVMIGPTIVQVGWDAYEQEDAKTDASEDWVAIGPLLADALREWRKRQISERLRWGETWNDSKRVFTRENGEPYHPAQVSERFYRLSFGAEMPPVRLHDLRHGAATLALAAGKTMKEVSAMMRHSSEAITSEIYAHVLPELRAEVSAAVVSMVPRAKASPFGRKAAGS